jgi:transposase-like protein
MDESDERPAEVSPRAWRPYQRRDESTRAAVIARCLDGDEPITRVAAELGVSHKTAWGWVDRERMRRLDPDRRLPPEVRRRLLAEQQKVAELERRNAELQRQLEFTKKAGAFFQETDRRGTDTQ